MKKTGKMACLAASVAMVASTHAAVISFSGPVSATNTSVLDAQWLAGGTFVEAANVGGSAQSFTTAGGQSITFGTSTFLGNGAMPAAPSSTSGFYNGGTQTQSSLYPGTTDVAAWTTVLQSDAWHNNGSDSTSPLTLRLGNLTIGQQYSVSLFAVDQRAASADRTQQYWSGFSGGTFSGGSSASFSTTNATMVSGTFTADATYQDVFIHATDAIGNADTTLQAYTLYAIPEPATIGLIGVFGVGMLFVRRRLML